MAQQDRSRPQAPAKRREQPRHWLISTCQGETDIRRNLHPAKASSGTAYWRALEERALQNRRQPYGPKEWAEPTPITGRLRERPTVVKSSLKRLTPIPA